MTDYTPTLIEGRPLTWFAQMQTREGKLTVRGYTIAFEADAPDPETPFLLSDPAGDPVDYYATPGEAVDDAQIFANRAEDEARDERLQALRDEIDGLLPGCEDEGRLRAILAILKS